MEEPERGEIGEVVHQIMDHDPILLSALYRGILSQRSTARWIKRKNNWNNISEESIVSAIRRYEDNNWDYGEEINIGLGDTYNQIKAIRKDFLSKTSLIAVSYFHKKDRPIDKTGLDSLVRIVGRDEYSFDYFEDILEENIKRGKIKRRGSNGNILLPEEDLADSIPERRFDELEYMLNEEEFIYPPLDESLENGGKRGVKERLREMIFIPYPKKGDFLKIGLLSSCEDEEWMSQEDIEKSIEEIIEIDEPDFLLSRYLSNLENEGLLESRGGWRHIQYRSSEEGEEFLQNIETLEEAIEAM